VPLRGPGAACDRSGQCTSGHCVDGVCCDTACTGQCEACDAAGFVGTCAAISGSPHGHRMACNGTGTCGGTCNGTARDVCTYPGSSVHCRDAACTAAVATGAATCDGMGMCGTSASTPCGAYACDGLMCRTACTQPSHCAPGNYCNELGQCVAVPAGARGCASDADCQGGSCADGICCDHPCNGACQSCRIAGSVGRCSPLPRGTTPTQAADGGTVTCMACDGTGGCLTGTNTDAGAPSDLGAHDGATGTGGPASAAQAGCGCHIPARTGGGAPAGLLLALAALGSVRRRRRG